MIDTFSKQDRSNIMRAVKSKKNSSTELRLIELFKHNKIVGWRRNYKIFGKPDFVFQKKKIAIFVDGCFWHGHDCRNTTPSSNQDYWQQKIKRNKERDIQVSSYLTGISWNVLRFWECELKKKPEKIISQILCALECEN